MMAYGVVISDGNGRLRCKSIGSIGFKISLTSAICTIIATTRAAFYIVIR